MSDFAGNLFVLHDNSILVFARRRPNVAVSPVTAAEHSVICNDMRRLS